MFQTRDDRIRIVQGDALIVLDVQIDYLPGGSVAVPQGDAVVEPLNRGIEVFTQQGQPIFAVRCWHPPQHCSFTAQGGALPPHCIGETQGAQFAPGLRLPRGTHVVSIGTHPDRDARSAFDHTRLADQLKEHGVRRLFVGGLATEQCVLWTVRAAREASFAVRVLTDAVRGYELHRGDSERALRQMWQLGAMSGVSDELKR